MTAPAQRNDPAFINVIGKGGEGKTVENVYSWAAKGLFLAQPGAMRVGRTVCGFDVGNQQVDVQNMEQVPYWIKYAKENGYEAVVADDASLLMKNMMMQAKPRFKVGENARGIPMYDRGMWSYFRDVLTDVALTARWAGIHVIFNWHPQLAFLDFKTKEEYPAGPDTGWAKLVKEPHHVGCVTLWATGRPAGCPPWDTRAWNDPTDHSKLSKDRFDIAIGPDLPLNTAELLRCAGFGVSRPVGMEWMEETAVDISAKLLATAGYQEAVKASMVAAQNAAKSAGWGAGAAAPKPFQADAPDGETETKATDEAKPPEAPAPAPVWGSNAAPAADLASFEKPITTAWVTHLHSHNVDPKHIRWALRDGVHRARYLALKAQTVLEGF